MTPVIETTCQLCGHHMRGLTVDEFISLDASHECQVADLIRQAIPYWRRGPEAFGLVADWLENCAGQADAMPSPTSFGICDEPGSVQQALKVAQATPREAS